MERRKQNTVPVADETGFRAVAPRIPHLVRHARRSCAPQYRNHPAMPQPAPKWRSRATGNQFLAERHHPTSSDGDSAIASVRPWNSATRSASSTIHRPTSDGFNNRLRLSLLAIHKIHRDIECTIRDEFSYHDGCKSLLSPASSVTTVSHVFKFVRHVSIPVLE